MPAPESEIQPPALTTLNPWRDGAWAAFASSAPVWGAAKALLHAGKDKWETDPDNDGKPRFVHTIAGAQMIGKFGYHIIVPGADTDAVQVAERELAEALLRDLGLGTSRLHTMCAVYSATARPGVAASVPRSMVHQALGLDKRTDLTLPEKDKRAFAEISRLSQIGLSVMRLELGGAAMQVEQRITPLWYLGIQRRGRVWEEQQSGETVSVWEDWSLLVRPGMWSDWFLFGERSLRQLGYVSRALFAADDRSRFAFAIGLLVHVRARLDPGPAVTLTPREMLEFCGEDVRPEDRRTRRDLQVALVAAIDQQGEWGCQIDFAHWPGYLRPQGAREKAEGESVERAPRGYWDTFLAAPVSFRLPPDLMAANLGVAAARERVEGKRRSPKAGAGRGPSVDVGALRSRLGWTQRQLADAVGVTDAAIRAYESGRKRPGKAVAERLRRLGKTEPDGSVGAERPRQVGLLESQGVQGAANGSRKADMRSRKPD